MHGHNDVKIYEANEHELHESSSRLTDSPIVDEEHHRHPEKRRRVGKHTRLAPGEHVLFKASPHWTGILPGLLFLGSLFAIPITLLFLGFHQAAIISFFVLAAATPLAVIQLLATRRANRLTVTNQRMICSRGLFDHEHRGIPIGQITNVTTHHDLLQKIIGTGTVKVDVAGLFGPEIFPNISDPDKLAELLVRLVDDYEFEVANDESGESRPHSQPQPSQSHQQHQYKPASEALGEIERLHTLLKSGAISEDEYENAKTTLLRRL